jgi:hypothetical protein
MHEQIVDRFDVFREEAHRLAPVSRCLEGPRAAGVRWNARPSRMFRALTAANA